MTRKQLLNLICPNDYINNCRFIDCDYCNVQLNKLLDKYDKHVIEQYKANTGINDTIREIHDNVAREMYCKGIDDLCKAISVFGTYDEYGNVIDILEIVNRLKAGDKE